MGDQILFLHPDTGATTLVYQLAPDEIVWPRHARVAPDRSWVALTVAEPSHDLWVLDFETEN